MTNDDLKLFKKICNRDRIQKQSRNLLRLFLYQCWFLIIVECVQLRFQITQNFSVPHKLNHEHTHSFFKSTLEIEIIIQRKIEKF